MKAQVLFSLVFAVGAAQAQTNCGCNYTVAKDGNYKANQLNLQPGQTLCIQAGQYAYLRFNELQGAPGAPIRLINCGGLVNVLSSSYMPGIQLTGCTHVVLTGSGDASLPYGFKLNNTGTTAGSVLSVTGKSSDIEIERTEVSNANFAGIMVKTDPGCDPMFDRENFTMYNVKIHDNYVHDTGGEGLYIGNSFWSGGRSVTCDGVTRTVFPHELHGLQIHHNLIERTGCEGIQYGCAPGAMVHHNTIRDAGLNPFASFQNSGLQIGEGSSGECYNNVIVNAPGGGIPIVGFNGNLNVYNNVIANIGSIGIFADDRANCQPGTYLALLNNTIVNCGDDGIKLYSNINVNTGANNVIAAVEVPKYITFGQGATATQSGNVTTSRADTLGFVNLASADFRLTATSPLRNVGTDLSSWGIDIDLADAPRPEGSAFDAGAYEYQSSGGVLRRAAPATVAVVSDSVPDVLTNVVSGQEPKKTPTARAYPSPCHDQVTLEVPAGYRIEQVTVYGADGRVAAKKTPTGETPRCSLDTRRLAGGVYVYELKTPSRMFTGKFVKQ